MTDPVVRLPVSADVGRQAEDPQPPPGHLLKVVVHLEITARPSGHVPAPAGRYVLLRSEEPTTPFYRFLYNSIGEQWLWTDRRHVCDTVLADFFRRLSTQLYVLYSAGTPAGFFELSQPDDDARSEQDGSTLDLAYFGLMPEFIGRGISRWLLRTALDTAFDQGVRRVIVNTCSFDHPRALSLYQRSGFAPYRRETFIVPDPRLTGDMPRTSAPHVPLADEPPSDRT